MNKIFLVLGLVLVVATVLFSGCVANDSSNTTNNTNTNNNNVVDNTNANGVDNESNDMTQPPAFPSD
jgi:uncharacterized membrane protein